MKNNADQPVVTMHNVAKHYDKVTALKNVNLNLFAGEVLGLFGHNGAGKTTMMKLILGIIKSTHGEVKVFDTDPMSAQAFESRKHIGYLPENVSFYDHLTGKEVLTYFARLKQAPKSQVVELLEQVGLTHAMKRPVKTYSKGMRQRLGLAQAFLGTPKLLLLDEPTVGLDPIATQEFYQSVDKLKVSGASIILCSHVLPGVEQHIDKAMIISSGQPLAQGSLVELRERAQLPVNIKTKGLNGALVADERFVDFLVKANHLQVPESQKLTITRQLLDMESITDIQVEPADLEQVYQYYLSGKFNASHKAHTLTQEQK
ncbi:ABC transporter ATP-binding protein [Parashewanella spongiae]|uniref:ABC transporter ATP-binding protein n=1 Tax=Parashewanella spongiae TaxID=342950 RepID=A0A3A6ULB4_9GAMM|nr:ABC transporter ATP-binding protein [Parashewanella spongiae]MCL1077926.1 ABC transporter ATP-binding protein [Parashewanella spongiae]RJY18453.1 ABC transporter ATP-binding protein [Parashewanella spongiae]